MKVWGAILSFFCLFWDASETCYATMNNLRDVVTVSDAIHRSGVQKMMELYADHYYPEIEANDSAQFSANLEIDCSKSCAVQECVQEMQKSLTQTIAIIGEDCAESKSRIAAKSDGDFSTVQMLTLQKRSDSKIVSTGISLANFVGNCRTIVTNLHNLYLDKNDERSEFGDYLAFVLPEVDGVSQPFVFEVAEQKIVISDAASDFRALRSSRAPTTSEDYAIITLETPIPNCSYYEVPESPTRSVDLPIDHPSLRFVAIRRDPSLSGRQDVSALNLFSFIDQKSDCGGFKTPKTRRWISDKNPDLGVAYNDYSLINGNSGAPLLLGDQFIGMHVGVEYDLKVKRLDHDDYRDLPFEAQEDGRSALNRTVLLQGRFYDNLREVLKKQAEAEVVQGSSQDGSTPL